jgi:hypothetical protein
MPTLQNGLKLAALRRELIEILEEVSPDLTDQARERAVDRIIRKVKEEV